MLAGVLPALGRRDEARATAEKALEIRRAKGSPNDQANTLNTMAGLELDPHKTLPLYEEAREIWR